ncbi:YaaA family protein [Haloplasma contractile]|uniref:UPF0246 protein HLPCO_002787 n=1 Tax=Haloplasma contractile SSD-17B TaxID=1033810 RepID=U2E7P1_9MOLU|nr:YaaA family protein [Haloplasma contractile]ERJ11218.1 hypothetical protein HLPCO_002787 [Haloplasma contractile SSD-17B]
MKIIMSPSKTQDFSKDLSLVTTTREFKTKTDELLDIINDLSKEDIATIMKIKGTLLEDTYQNYQNYVNLPTNKAITSYTGAVFKGLEIDHYTKTEQDYLNDHLRILSALYGVLKPTDEIKPYRLDMKMKILDEGLYSFWTETITELFKKENLIINLASNEFSKLIKLPMITINFKEHKNGIYKVIGAYAKKARGKMIHYMIKNQVQDIETIKQFNTDGYAYNRDLSSEKDFIFTRSTSD